MLPGASREMTSTAAEQGVGHGHGWGPDCSCHIQSDSWVRMEKQKLLLFLRYFLQWIDSWSTEYTPGSGVVAGQQKFGLLEEVVFFSQRENIKLNG